MSARAGYAVKSVDKPYILNKFPSRLHDIFHNPFSARRLSRLESRGNVGKQRAVAHVPRPRLRQADGDPADPCMLRLRVRYAKTFVPSWEDFSPPPYCQSKLIKSQLLCIQGMALSKSIRKRCSRRRDRDTKAC